MNGILPLLLIVVAELSWACDHPIGHYTSMGCEPSCRRTPTGCPASYKCPHLTNPAAGMCYLGGKTYSIGDYIPEEETLSGCIAGAFCEKSFENPAATQVIYAVFDCAEFFMPPLNQTCVRQYKTKSCCSSGQVCGDAVQQLATCTLGGQVFMEGQRMEIPGNPCKSCICAPGFDENKIESNPNCYETRCFFEIYDTQRVYGGAIPVYMDYNRCCPSSWRMPEATDKVVKGLPYCNVDATMTCKYGNLTLDVGDSLEPFSFEGGVYDCKCAVPPLMHCMVTIKK
ncbi:uncharacterized protein LOC129756105 isoform X2 [Uranotaenia lowii]|uniref:uncharacterized protein LOC129756105 isoform X2 n=1 Tax=Uranotaenia lowii TaxID=190385 RepID=UPI0024786088|nr:uncharacterized protein LOC129756105 isoform X2 [Uranotaenia lowii]